MPAKNLTVRFHDDERQLLSAAAALSGSKVSDYIRQAALEKQGRPSSPAAALHAEIADLRALVADLRALLPPRMPATPRANPAPADALDGLDDLRLS